MKIQCEKCGGHGLIDQNDTTASCPACDGSGYQQVADQPGIGFKTQRLIDAAIRNGEPSVWVWASEAQAMMAAGYVRDETRSPYGGKIHMLVAKPAPAPQAEAGDYWPEFDNNAYPRDVQETHASAPDADEDDHAPEHTYAYRFDFSRFSEAVFTDGTVVRRIEQPGGGAEYALTEKFGSLDEYFAALADQGINDDGREIDGEELAPWLAALNDEDNENEYDWYDDAHSRVVTTPGLRAYSAEILADWPEGDLHYKWVATAPEKEILDWAEHVRRAQGED